MSQGSAPPSPHGSPDSVPSSRRSLMSPVASVVDALSRVQRALHHIRSIRLRPGAITPASHAALHAMSARPDLTLGELSRLCFVRPQTMTRVVA